MAASGTGSAAWPGRLPGGGSTVSVIVATAIVVADMVGVGVFTSLGFQVKDIPSGFAILLLWTRRRHCRAVRRVFLQRTRRDVSALERRIQFPEPRLSSGVRISGGLGVGDGRFRSAGGAGRDGVRAIRQIGASGRAAAGAGDRRGLAGVDRATQRRQALQHLSTDLDHSESRADRRVPDRGICHRHAATGLVCAVGFRLRPRHQRAVRDRPCVRDVFVFRMERRDLHHRRDAHAAAEPAARAAGGNADRACAVCRAECGVPPHHADRQTVRATRCRPHRRQPHLRRNRRPHRRCDDLHRAGIFDQRDDVDRPARHDDDGGGHSGAAGIRPQIDARARRPMPSFSSSRSPA